MPIIKTSGVMWFARKNGKEMARMFYDADTQRYEVWSIFENDPIETYKTLKGGMKKLNSYLDD